MIKETFIQEKRPHESATKHVSGYALYTDDISEPEGTLYGAIGWSKKSKSRRQWPAPRCKPYTNDQSSFRGLDGFVVDQIIEGIFLAFLIAQGIAGNDMRRALQAFQ